VKTPRGGYDGKGVRVVRGAEEADDWLAAGPVLAEELIAFRRELAQLVARRPSGESAAWPLAETLQVDGVCAEVIAPAPDSAAIVDEARRIAAVIAEGLGVTGVLAVELFETTDGQLLVNELAMRPHNSGHWSIDGAVTSQFEQHLRAVLDLPLGDPATTAPVSVMVNVLGGPAGASMPDRYPAAFAAHADVKFHSYGKESRPGRKVGHVTATGQDVDAVRDRARAAATFFER
jgi:5-(carboxyamino)imidazole ribonucleotide synthase